MILEGSAVNVAANGCWFTGVNVFTYLARQVYLRKEASDDFHYAAVTMIVG